MIRRCFILLCACSGCVSLSEGKGPRAQQVKVSGCCLELQEPARLTPELFLRQVQELLKEKRLVSATMLVRRFPDLAAAALRQAEPTSEFLLFVARTHDQALAHRPGAGWEEFLQRHRGTLAEAEKALAQGQAGIETEQWTTARGELERGWRRFNSICPEQACRLALLLAEAERRLERFPAAAAAWQNAARQAAATGRPGPLHDPILWEKISAQRPAQTAWPTEVAEALRKTLDKQFSEAAVLVKAPDEALVWFYIGLCRHERGEAKAALSAFKRAESIHAEPAWRAWTQLHQAKAMVILEQSAAAVTLLAALAENSDPALRAAACATLGAVRLNEGAVQQALLFLRKALDGASFPGRAQVSADLGLAYLSTGDETQGLRWLHAAQDQFKGEHSTEHLILSLENEASYYEHSHRDDLASARRAEARRLETLTSACSH